MSDAREIAQTLGRQDIAHAVGVKRSAVSMAVTSGKFPAAWYKAMRDLADERGVPALVSMDVFSFKTGEAAQ